MPTPREEANREAVKRLMGCEPVLVDVQRAIDVVPGMTPNKLLTSGAPIDWPEITGIQRTALLHGAIYEGLATTPEEAEAKLNSGEIVIGATQLHGSVGPATGICTASMPVFVVKDPATGECRFCTLVEGNPPRVFANGAWGDDVRERLAFVDQVLAPVIGEAVRIAGGIPLKPITRRAIAMGDDLHFRVEAGTQLFLGALYLPLLEVAKQREADVRRVISFLQTTPVSFLRVAVAGAKAALDAAHGIEHSSLVTAMILSSKEFAIRVSGLHDAWFRGPFPEFLGVYFWGSGPEDCLFAGGESSVMETSGLGGFVMASALSLPFGGPAEQRFERNRMLYDITLAENEEYKIPVFNRGAPCGIDIFKVVDTGIPPFLHGSMIRKDGTGSAGVGPMRVALEPFVDAVAAYRARYGSA